MNGKCTNTGVLFIHNLLIMSFERKWVKLSCLKKQTRFFFKKSKYCMFSAMQNGDIKQ